MYISVLDDTDRRTAQLLLHGEHTQNGGQGEELFHATCMQPFTTLKNLSDLANGICQRRFLRSQLSHGTEDLREHRLLLNSSTLRI